MDINKLINLIGLGNDKDEELEEAMARELLPDIRRKQPGQGPSGGDATPTPGGSGEPDPAALPEGTRLISAGRCPTCGDRIVATQEQPCAWCNTPCRPEQDGYHLVHVALGAFQERHSFCSDDCFEAFRRMYPARVHRDCYERECRSCHYCLKRFEDELDGLPGPDTVSRPDGADNPKKA